MSCHSLKRGTSECPTCDLRRLSLSLRKPKEQDELCCICRATAKIPCGNCNIVWYCTRDHQSLHWMRSHERECEGGKQEFTRTSSLSKMDTNGTLARMYIVQRRQSIQAFKDVQRTLNDGDSEDICQLRDEALELAQRIHGSQHPAYLQALHEQALALYDCGKISSAVERLLKEGNVLKTLQSHKDTVRRQAENSLALGNCYLAQNAPDKALTAYQQSEELLKRIHRPPYAAPEFAAVSMNIGLCFQQLGRFSDALQAFKKSARLSEDMLGTDRTAVANVYSNLGSLYHRMGELSLAVRNYEKALDLLEKASAPDELKIPVHSYLGALQMKLTHYKPALTHLGHAKKMLERLPDRVDDTVWVCQQMAHVCEQQGRLVEAAKFLQQAHQLVPQLGLTQKVNSLRGRRSSAIERSRRPSQLLSRRSSVSFAAGS
eukprot:TRINITY_DN15372_c0_g1_i1.p1 TRINITY_DN15372_c0_g1~~TRINITY_DN15372_c0_g1_i1.p1  ORF type:complete len:432 (+),score=62.51 TRINITY_DN15372_c0_g1_i1:32-1327(+)